MKRFRVVCALVMLTSFAGVAVSATLSFNPGQTPAGSTITDNNGSAIAAQFGFGHDKTPFMHTYNFTSSDATSTIFAQLNQLPLGGINFKSIVLDGVQMSFDSLTSSWFGNGASTLAHSIVLMGNQTLEGSQYSLRASVVPVPAAIWLFGWAVAGLLGINKCKTSGKRLTA